MLLDLYSLVFAGPSTVELAGTSAGVSTDTASLSAMASLAGVSTGTCASGGVLACVAALEGVSAGTSAESAQLSLLLALAGTSTGVCADSVALSCLASLSGLSAGTCVDSATLQSIVVQRGRVRTALSVAIVRNALSLSTVLHDLEAATVLHNIESSVVFQDLSVESVRCGVRITGIVVGFGESAVEITDTFTRESGSPYDLSSCAVELLCASLVGGKKAATITSATNGAVKISFETSDFVASVGTEIAAGRAVTADAQWKITTPLSKALGVPAQMARFPLVVRPWA